MLINMPAPNVLAEKKADKEMLSVSQEGEITTVYVNYSSLAAMQECPRKAFFSLERKLRGPQGAALIFGTAVHKALETFYSAPRSERLIPKDFEERSDLLAYNTQGQEAEELLFRCIKDFVTAAEPIKGLSDNDKRSISSGVWMLQHYFKTYIDDPWEVLFDAEGKPYTERRVQKEIYNDGKLRIIVFGTIDVILRNAQTGVILAADHKTSSIIGNDFYNRLKPNLQYGLYLYLARTVLGIDSAGFLVNCLETKSRPLTARGGPPKFIRQVTTRDEDDNEDMLRTVVSLVKQYLSWKAENYFPLGYVNSCASYGGCSFLEVCQAPISIRETIIENKFKTKENT